MSAIRNLDGAAGAPGATARIGVSFVVALARHFVVLNGRRADTRRDSGDWCGWDRARGTVPSGPRSGYRSGVRSAARLAGRVASTTSASPIPA